MAPQLKGGSCGLLLPLVILTGPFQLEMFCDCDLLSPSNSIYAAMHYLIQPKLGALYCLRIDNEPETAIRQSEISIRLLFFPQNKKQMPSLYKKAFTCLGR